MWAYVVWSTLCQDLRFACRLIAKRPGFSLAIVLTVGLGIGAGAALFSVVRAVLLAPLPYRDPQRLVVLTRGATPVHFEEFRASARSYTDTGAYAGVEEQLALTGAGDPVVLKAARVSANFLGILGVPPAVGRGFLPAEDHAGAPAVAMISSTLWQQRLGGNTAAIGHAILLGGTPYTVIGVLPPHFAFPFADVDVWITQPEEFSGIPAASRPFSPFLNIFGRLGSGITLEQANAELPVLNRQYAAAHPAMLDAKPNSAASPSRIASLGQTVIADARLPLLLLSGAVLLLLLIVCANVASLLLARAATRAREFAVRSALGAGRVRLLRQLLTESVLLSLGGGALGVLLAGSALRAIRRVTSLLPRSTEIHLDLGVLAFAIVLSLITGLLFGLGPAFVALRRDVAAVLQGNGLSRLAGGRRRWMKSGPRGLLVSGQVAVSLVLVVGAGLLLRTLAHLYNVDPGFRPDHVLTMSISLSPALYDTDAKREGFYSELVTQVKSIPGVEHAGLTLTLPTAGFLMSPIQIIGQPEPPLNQRPLGVVQEISPDYLQTLSIPLKRGRRFRPADDAHSAGVAIIDEAMARRFWPQYPGGENPVAQRLMVGRNRQPLDIVGVVANVHQQGLDTDPRPGIYLPSAQQPPQAAILAVRTHGDPGGFADTIRRRVLSINHDQPVSEVRTLSAVVDASELERRLLAGLLTAFAAAATLLAVLGLYSVIAYSVVERTKEIAIRQALGAPRGSVLALVLREGLGLAMAGVAAGIALAAGLTRLLSSLLFGIHATDPVTFLAASVLFLIVAAAASLLPARRASAIQPMQALREI